MVGRKKGETKWGTRAIMPRCSAVITRESGFLVVGVFTIGYRKHGYINKGKFVVNLGC